MDAITSPFSNNNSITHFADQEKFEGSGQVLRGPEPRGGEPEQERFARLSGAEGLGGPSALGAADKTPWGGEAGFPPYLVFSPNNSAGEPSASRCRNPILLKGRCFDHGNKRYRMVPCKRRDCESCGRVGRLRIAQRIAYGVRTIRGSEKGCAWLVGTFASQEAEDPSFKKKARRKVASFIRALRKETGVDLQYALTWELTTARHRLHVNVIIGPWVRIPHKRLVELWGARISVEWVKDDRAMGIEAAKPYSIEGLSGYLSKLDQAVPREWGRRVSFSKGWPKVPKEGLPRVGQIVWSYPDQEERIEFHVHEGEGRFIEVEPGEFAYPGESCMCFVLSKDHNPSSGSSILKKKVGVMAKMPVNLCAIQ